MRMTPTSLSQTKAIPSGMGLYFRNITSIHLDDRSSVYDWLQRKRISHFFNGNPRGTSITSLHFINQDVGGIILTAAGKFKTFGLTLSHFPCSRWYHPSLPELRSCC